MRRTLATSLLAVGSLFFAFSAAPTLAGVARAQLNSSLPEVRFSGVSLSDAVDFLRDVTGANIAVNWKALEAQGITKDMPLNVRLHSVSLRKALETVLSEVGADKLAYDVDQNVIEITTKELVDARLITRVYPIQDLIMEIPDFTDAPDLSINSTSNNEAQNPHTGGGIGAGNSGGNNSGLQINASTTPTPVKTREERAADLVELIKATIAPDAWTDAGGKSAIRFYNGNLVVTAPRSVQDAIGGARD